MALVLRNQQVAFFGVKEELDTTFKRMKGFTDMSKSVNPIEYTRKYVDEPQETTDVTGMSPSLSFTFDRMTPNPVHDDIANIIDKEMLGSDAVRSIVIVDLFSPTGLNENECHAQKRDFSIVGESVGSGTDALVYSGTFRANGGLINGKATTTDNWQTCTFVEEEEE